MFLNFKNTSVIWNLGEFSPTGDFNWRLFGELSEADNDVRQTAFSQIWEEVGNITRESASSWVTGMVPNGDIRDMVNPFGASTPQLSLLIDMGLACGLLTQRSFPNSLKLSGKPMTSQIGIPF